MIETPRDLLEEFRRFLLSSSKNTEQFSPELLNALNIPTELDRALVQAVRGGRDVVVAGSAGSGETHLITRLRIALPDVAVSEFGEDAPAGKERFVSVVSDLTGLADRDKVHVFDRQPNCQAVVVCANEGTLLLAARMESSSSERRARETYAAAIRILHRIQRGESVFDTEGPVVLDAAGFDPTFGAALSSMLGNPLLKSAVNSSSKCDCDPVVCPRRQAWSLLDDSETRRRLSSLIAAAALEAEGFTFRVLWNFVADLALGGNCEMRGTPPKSAWFWRVFNGDSLIAERLKDAFPLRRIPMPRAEARLWYGDWSWFEKPGVLLGGISRLPVLPPIAPCNTLSGDAADSSYEWLKAQAIFALAEDPFHSAKTMVTAGSLWGSICDGQQHLLIQELNRYMTYGLGTAGSSLELWVDYSMERRLERPDGQLSVGHPSATDFEIARSRACGNLSDREAPILGARLFLHHRPSGAALALTRELLSVIIGGRSFRMADRLHTEVDWLLMSFFYAAARKAASPDHLRLALFNFRARSVRQTDWDVIAQPPSLTLTTKG